MAQLSLIAEAMGKARNAQYNTGRVFRSNPRGPTVEGVARGAMGVTGSRTFAPRDVDAGLNRERKELLENPIMQAYLRVRRKKLLF